MPLVAGQIPVSGYKTPDYSGAAAAAGAAGASPYKAISGIVDQAGDYFKKQKEDKNVIKQSGVQIDAALKLFPEMASVLQPYSDQLRDENIPLSERSFMASETSNYINNALNMMKTQTSMGLARQREARMGASAGGGASGNGASSGGDFYTQ
jgi:hypothetical protein